MASGLSSAHTPNYLTAEVAAEVVAIRRLKGTPVHLIMEVVVIKVQPPAKLSRSKSQESVCLVKTPF
jgi:hypothetical protein